jgi:hypothetical protein
MNEKVVHALLWIKNILEEQSIPYQIVGGLASNIHGGSRPVADIDLYIPTECAEKILPKVQDYISKPLVHCVEGSWDLEYFQIIYQEQKIEIGLSPGTKIFNKNPGQWIELITDYSQSVMGKYEGVEVPVIPVPELVAYKTLLGRDVDHIDIEELTGIS